MGELVLFLSNPHHKETGVFLDRAVSDYDIVTRYCNAVTNSRLPSVGGGSMLRGFFFYPDVDSAVEEFGLDRKDDADRGTENRAYEDIGDNSAEAGASGTNLGAGGTTMYLQR